MLQLAAAAPFLQALPAPAQPAFARVRPGAPGWPAEAEWKALGEQVHGTLIKVQSPWPACRATPTAAACQQLFQSAKNPWFLGDEVAMTQTLGWIDAWTSSPSVYAVAARNAQDVAAAVNFARQHRLRLVVKGGGHSYQGTSNAPDSLLVWTRKMNAITMHDAFVAAGCSGTAPVRAVSIGAGAVWAQAYDAVTTRAGGYVQGGGCMTVGVAGLIQSGGFGSFSKAFGLAAASLLEAEVVTADGQVRIANACQNADLFWGLKGGGGGSLGVVTRVTLRVHPLPENFGAVNFTVHAKSPAAFRRLVGLAIDHYADRLMNPHWGEQMRFRPGDELSVSMVFQGLGWSEARAVWKPFFDAIDAASQDFSIDFSPLKIVSTSARDFFAPTLVKRTLGFIKRDDRPGAPEGNVFWPGDQGQAGQVLHAYQSTWMPASLLQADQRAALCDALFAASRHAGVSLHFNKGLAGAPPQALAAARDTAINPAAIAAFALAISGANEQPAYPGVAGHEPHPAQARQSAQAVARCRDALRKVVPNAGSYVSESDYFEQDWQHAFWGPNYERLRAVKARYDPEGLFFVHHGVGSEAWSEDGFTRRSA
nr:FAD-binding oxidoreductase [Ramlibacter agri]